MSETLHSYEDNVLHVGRIGSKTGMFSDCSVLLAAISAHLTRHQSLPERVEVSMFSSYEGPGNNRDLYHFFFTPPEAIDVTLDGSLAIRFLTAHQFLPYGLLDYPRLAPLVRKYFSPSSLVLDVKTKLERKYGLNHQRLISVYYRGNDKATETTIGSYEGYLSRTAETLQRYPNSQLLVQTDELEFRDAFFGRFPQAIQIEEMPVIPSDTRPGHAVLNTLEMSQRRIFGATHLAVTLLLAASQHVITHSGNCSLWVMLYRGGARNVQQFLDFSAKSAGCRPAVPDKLFREDGWYS